MFPVLVLLALGIVTAFFAKQKGYTPKYWFFTAGIVGWIMLAILPNTNASTLPPEEKTKKKTNGDRLGVVISLVAIALGICSMSGDAASQTANGGLILILIFVGIVLAADYVVNSAKQSKSKNFGAILSIIVGVASILLAILVPNYWIWFGLLGLALIAFGAFRFYKQRAA